MSSSVTVDWPAGHPGDACLALIVESDERIGSVLARLLGSAGYGCITVTTAKEAVIALAQHRPVLAVLDLTAIGAEGGDLARYLKLRSPGVHVVGITRHMATRVGNDLLDNGFDGIFSPTSDYSKFARLCVAIRRRALGRG
jgi:DNA-binding response OmpR family regulator